MTSLEEDYQHIESEMQAVMSRDEVDYSALKLEEDLERLLADL